jgi:alkanesulfonate monooxygenase SsuD/methylene tetrahydromethanopterin reductase-like flavin-dependent oxidoreductase (luciferase family)
MKKCWSGEPFEYHGEYFNYEDVRVLPAPKRMDVWLGGIAPSELKRVGRVADGWLPSFVTPADAAAGRAIIEAVAAEHERSIDDDHYGVLIPYSFGAVPDVILQLLAKRRPDLNDVTQLVPSSWDGVAQLIQQFVDIGTTKFVVLPVDEPRNAEQWSTHIGEAADVLLPLEVG